MHPEPKNPVDHVLPDKRRKTYQREDAKSQLWVVVVLSVILAALITIQQDQMPLTEMSQSTIQLMQKPDWAKSENFEALAAPLVIAH